MKSIPDFAVNLSRVEKVCSSEGQTVIEKESPVGNIYCLEGHRPAFSKTLTERQIEGRVLGQTSRPAIIREARSVVEVRGAPSPIREVHISSDAKGVTLIVVEQEKVVRWREEGKTPGSFTPPLGTLAGVGQVHLAATQ